MGRGKDAVSDATRCIEHRPYWPKGYFRQGAAYMLLKVKIIVTLCFLWSWTWSSAGVYLQDYTKACKSFEDGLKLDYTNVDIKNALR